MLPIFKPLVMIVIAGYGIGSPLFAVMHSKQTGRAFGGFYRDVNTVLASGAARARVEKDNNLTRRIVYQIGVEALHTLD